MKRESHARTCGPPQHPSEAAALSGTLPSPTHPSSNLLLQPLPPPFLKFEIKGSGIAANGGVSQVWAGVFLLTCHSFTGWEEIGERELGRTRSLFNPTCHIPDAITATLFQGELTLPGSSWVLVAEPSRGAFPWVTTINLRVLPDGHSLREEGALSFTQSYFVYKNGNPLPHLARPVAEHAPCTADGRTEAFGGAYVVGGSGIRARGDTDLRNHGRTPRGDEGEAGR